jgi:DNA mismatch repair protein MutS2
LYLLASEKEKIHNSQQLENFFSVKNLEFEKVIEFLDRLAYSSLGKEWVSKLVPWRIRHHQQETSEARTFIDREEKVPSFSNLKDTRRFVTFAMKGSTLTIENLWDIAGTVRTVRQIRESIKGNIGSYPILEEYANKLRIFPDVEEQLFHSLDDEETISDRATPELKKFRGSFREKNSQIQERSKQLARKYADKSMLTDTTFTLRNNRYVLPFSSGAMGHEKIVIQSSSESGLTFYGEPLELVELNNDLQKALQLVRNEEERVLQMLSAKVGIIGEDLLPCIEICGYLDFIFAKGYLSREYDAVEPVLDATVVRLNKVRHPLIRKDIVVPLDLSFGGKKKGLIITGPNAGGKTVTIKTIGLIALMAQAGLHIPVKEKSAIPIFRSILAEIGDAQSIDLDLSSFGAHIKFLKTVVKSLDEVFNPDDTESEYWIEEYKNWKTRGIEVTKETPKPGKFSPYDILQSDNFADKVKISAEESAKLPSLILLDEIGRSTDPEEGSAIALALIDRMIEKGAFFALTTHLPALKNLVISDNSPVTGAAMGFDIEKLNTNYKIEQDTIGASYGIVIAEKMGLDPELLKNAKVRLAGRFNLLEMDIPKLEAKRDELRDYVEGWAKKQSLTKREELRELSRLITLKRMGFEYLIESVEQAEIIVRESGKKADRLIELARKGKKVKKEFDNQVSELKVLQEKLEEAYSAMKRLETVDEIRKDLQKMEFAFHDGDRVWVSILNREGVIEKIRKGGQRLTVVMDGKRMEIDSEHASLLDKPAEERKRSRITIDVDRKPPPPLWLDLHGERVEVALQKVEMFLNDAALSNRAQVNIMHGIGTGALRKAIREFLRKHPLVKSFRDGDAVEGKIGSTIVEFKHSADYDDD